jgi:hypothetical protein
MSATYRWYRFGTPRKTNIVRVITEQKFTTSSESGFIRVESEDAAPMFRFLWRSRVVITKLDEDGTPFTEEMASVSFMDFAIFKGKRNNYFRLVNPGRSSRQLFDTLETILGLGFTCEPIRLRVADSKNIFVNADSAKLIGLSASGVVLGPDLVAKVDLASKSGISIANVKVLNGTDYKIDFSAFEISYRGLKGMVAFSSSGAVKISGRLKPALLASIENCLEEMP